MFFGKVYIHKEPEMAQVPEYTGDIAFDIDGLRYMVDVEWSHAAPEIRTAAPAHDERYAALRTLAEAETEITIWGGSFDQDPGAAQGAYPGGGLNVEFYTIGRMTLDQVGGQTYWRDPDGTFNAPAEEIAAAHAGRLATYLAGQYPAPHEASAPRLTIVRPD